VTEHTERGRPAVIDPNVDTVVSKVTFVDPPSNRVRYDWYTIADELRANPMRWGMIFRNDRSSVAVALRQGAIIAMHPDLGFEFRTANNTRHPQRRCDLYARFNPDKVVGLRAAIEREDT